MVTRIAQGRKEREIDPAAAALRASVADATTDSQVSPIAMARLNEMLEFIETINGWYEQMLGVPKSKLVTLIKMGSRVVDLQTLGRGKKAKKKGKEVT